MTFFPRSKHLLIFLVESPSAVMLEHEKIKSVTVSIVSPSICHEMVGPDAISVFRRLSFQPAFSLSSFPFIKRLFSFSLFSVIRVMPSAYLRLLIFLLAILSPVCESSSLSFLMMYSTQRLNKQGDNIQPCHTPFPVLNMSDSNCCFLSCIQASQETSKVVWYSHLL